MKSRVSLVVLALVLLQFATKVSYLSAAQTQSGSTSGEVTSVNPKSGMLIVKTKDKDLNLTAESKSAKYALEKVKPGDTVRVNYTDKDGKMVVTSVKTESKGMAKSEEKKAEKKAEQRAPGRRATEQALNCCYKPVENR